ncbi:hypothetical protein KBX53_24585 [Micromonospora sp. M51]|uniref:hypothetical protein n=1 Tax=Micromonospora sp. M51 TaxID=2824889 RepID=UPI001B38B819|nr:hypothetical protein [Micromonospora sp. M51]MBQ1014065.1 hypothetical protein [Micromonospora sp. M51]
MLVNLTPHPIRIFGWQVPDHFDLGEHEPHLVIEPSGTVARIGQIELGTQYLRHCPAPVEYVDYRHANGLPPRPAMNSPQWHHPTIWYVVSLALALSQAGYDRGVPGVFTLAQKRTLTLRPAL